MQTVGMKSLDVDVISRALGEARVWHRIQNGFICTKKTRVKIPEISDKVAYLAGVITGDGHLTRSKRKTVGYHYVVGIVGRRGFTEQLCLLIKEIFHYTPGFYKDKRKNDCYYVNIYPVAIFYYFIELGFRAGKKRNLRVPSLIAKDASLFKHFMCGLIDTDGFIDKKRVQLKQKDKGFLNELVRLLKKRLDISATRPKVNFTEGKPYFYIRFPFEGLAEGVMFRKSLIGQRFFNSL
jgi:hypothetical protein